MNKCLCGNILRLNGRNCNACHALSMRKHRRLGKEKINYPDRVRARWYLHTYLKRGKVTKSPCAVCGDIKVEAHHADYSKPLVVLWLCRLHHKELHRLKIS